MRRTILATAVLLTAVIACKTKQPTAATAPAPDCSAAAFTYEADIKPIIIANCATQGCHDAVSHKHGFDFTKPGDVKKEPHELLCTIKWEKGCPKMPIGRPKLPQADIDKIECWIKNGMK